MLWVAFVIIHLVAGVFFSALWHCLPRLSLPFLGRVSQSLTNGPLFPPSSLPPLNIHVCTGRCVLVEPEDNLGYISLGSLSTFFFFSSLLPAWNLPRDPLVSASPVLRLQGCTTMPSLLACFIYLINLSIYLL